MLCPNRHLPARRIWFVIYVDCVHLIPMFVGEFYAATKRSPSLTRLWVSWWEGDGKKTRMFGNIASLRNRKYKNYTVTAVNASCWPFFHSFSPKMYFHDTLACNKYHILQQYSLASFPLTVILSTTIILIYATRLITIVLSFSNASNRCFVFAVAKRTKKLFDFSLYTLKMFPESHKILYCLYFRFI